MQMVGIKTYQIYGQIQTHGLMDKLMKKKQTDLSFIYDKLLAN